MKRSDPLSRTLNALFPGYDVHEKRRRNQKAFNEVDIVIHYRCFWNGFRQREYNPSEFVHTNVMGAMNVIDAIAAGVVKKISSPFYR